MKSIDFFKLIQMIEGAYDELNLHKEEVNSLNVFPVPDGDTGINMLLTIKSSIDEINKVKPNTIKNFSLALRRGSLMGARGNSGVILSQIFLGFTNSFDDKEYIDCETLKASFRQGTEVAYRAVMRPVEGTMLTIIRCMAERVQLAEFNDIEDVLITAIKAGEEALEKTPEQLPVLKEAGVVDAGGLGLIYIFKGMLKALVDKATFDKVDVIKEETFVREVVGETLEYLYCTELLINSPNKSVEELENKLEEIGGSILVVGDESMIKVHVHTNSPDKVLELALKTGEIQDIKIDNMRLQHGEYLQMKSMEKQEPPKEWGIIVISQGEGFKEIFKFNGVDVIIPGGQTMNPSVEEIIESIEKLNAQKILLFVNNKNIIMAAEKAKNQVKNKEVFLIKTTHIVESISSLVRFNQKISPEENIKRFEEAIKDLNIIDITTAQRDGKMNGITYKKGDYIGLFGKEEILAVATDLRQVVFNSLDKIGIKEGSLITFYAGENMEEDFWLIEEVKRIYKAEVEWYYGGQPHYQFYICVE